MWNFYILECKDKTLYSGISLDLSARIIKHNKGQASKYTRSRRPVKLVYTEKFPDKVSALKREREVKSLKRIEKLGVVKEVASCIRVEDGI